jgi:hypothetical protein
MTIIYIDDKAVPLIDGGGGGCFSSDTLISIENGTISIADIEVGDRVWAFDEIGRLVLSEVTEVFYHPNDLIYRVTHENGYLDITSNHWVLKEDGTYQELKYFNVGDNLVTDKNTVSRILSIVFLKEDEVYNFKVSHLHSYIANGIKVHNGGGGGKGGGSGREDPNTLFSTDILFITLGLGEGPVYRINPNGPQDIEFNEGNIDDLIKEDGNINTEKFFTISNTGTITQQRLPLFGDFTFVPQRLQGAVDLKKGGTDGIPQSNVYLQSTSATALTAIKFYFIIGGLQQQNDKGDILADSITVRANVFDRSGTVEITSAEREIKGKTNTGYSFDLFLAIPPASQSDQGYKFTVEKTSPDYSTSKRQASVTFQGWTEIVEDPIAYVRTATIGFGLKAFAEHKGGIPAMTNMVKGLIVKVPSNYNQPILENGDIDWRQVEVKESDRISTTYGGYYQQKTGNTLLLDANPLIYDGLWDGQFVYSWTQNPAWIIYDMLTNSTYGLGIPESNIDKYSFYDVAVYCDACDVTTGRFYGVDAQADGTYRYKTRLKPPLGTAWSVKDILVGINADTDVKERRFILDTVVADQKQVMDTINNLTLTFRGILFYTGGKISLYQDKPDNMPVAVFNETNIIAGTLNISGVGEESLLTGVDITYNDMTNHYRREVLRVDDPKALTERNYIENIAKIDLAGVARKSQALRLAQYLIADTKYSRRKVGFKTGIEASEIAPGSVISVSQRASSVAWGFGGIVSNNSIDSNQMVYLEHIGSPAITSQVFTSNTKPLVLRVASSKSGLIDTYIISNTIYSLSNTSNVSGGAEIIGVKALKKYYHNSKEFTTFTGSWGDSHIPTRHDVWTLGQINDTTNIYSSLSDKLFKVINIKRDKDETVFLEGKEYISNVYTDSDTVINYNPLRYGDLFSPLLPPPNPDFTLSAIPKRDLDGSIYTDIDISAFTDRTGYSNELVTEFYHAKPSPSSSYSLISNTTPRADRNIVTMYMDDISQVTNGESAIVFGKNGFTTELGVSRLLVTSVINTDVDAVYNPDGNLTLTVSGLAGIIDKNFGPNIHVLEVNDTFSFGGDAKLKGSDYISIPLLAKDASEVDSGFIGYSSKLLNHSSNVLSFNKTANTIVIENERAGTKVIRDLLPATPFYINIPQIIDPRYFANNTLYITGGYTEYVRTNVITISNIVGNIFKQPLGISVRDKNFVDVSLDGIHSSNFTLEKGLDNLANSQVSVILTTLPKSISTIDFRAVANVYTAPVIEVGDNIAWGVGNTYGISETSYDIASPSYNAYLTTNGIYRVVLSDNIKSNISVGYAVNITPNPIGVVNNLNIATKTFTFDYPSETYPGLLNLGNNAIYQINTPGVTFEPLGKGDASIRSIRRAEKGVHTIKARTVNKYGRRSSFVTKSVVVRDIPIRAVDKLLINEELYKESTLGVAVRAIISFEAITNQEVTDYEISYKITGSNTGDLTSFNTVKVSSTGVDSDGKIRYKIDNIEKGLTSNLNKITVRIVPLNRTIRGSIAVLEQELRGKSAPPQNVINFAVGQSGESLVLVWQYKLNAQTGDNIDIDLLEVHIRKLPGSIDTSQSNLIDKWPRASDVAKVDARTNRVVIDIDQYGQYTYLVRTKDTSGNFSDSIVASLYTTIAQNFTNIYKAYSEDDPSGTYVSGITNANYGEVAYASFYASNNYGFPSSTFKANVTDNANGTSSGWSVIGGSPSDLRALSNAIYQTQIRDVGNVVTGSLQIEITGEQSLKSTWLDYATTIGGTQVTESTTSGMLRDVDFSGSLGIGNILGFSNVIAATVSYNNENKSLGSGDQAGYPANVYGIIATGNHDGDIANANVLCLIAGVVNASDITLGTSWYANGMSIGSNGFSNLTVAGTSYKLVNLRQWLDLSDAATFYGTTGTVTTNTEFRYTSSNPYFANGLVNNAAFTTAVDSDGYINFVSGARTFRYFQFRYKVNNFDPQQAELILDRFRYKIAINEKTYTESVIVDTLVKNVDYSRMAFTQTPKVSGTVGSSSNQIAQPQVVIIDRGVSGANIAVYFSNGQSAHNIGTAPVVDFSVTGV